MLLGQRTEILSTILITRKDNSTDEFYTHECMPTCEIVVIVPSPFHSHWTAVDSWNESASDELEIATVT